MSIYDDPIYDDPDRDKAAEAAKAHLASLPRHFIKVLTVHSLKWNDGITHVFRDKNQDLFLCVDETRDLFEQALPPSVDDECLRALRVGDKRVFHVFKPLLEQRPALSNYATDLVDCYLVNHAKILAAPECDSLSEHELYPAIDRFLRGTCGIKNGEHFYAYFTPWSEQTNKAEDE